MWEARPIAKPTSAMEIISDHGRMTVRDCQVNPVIDEHNQTADLAVELALSAFGKKILYQPGRRDLFHVRYFAVQKRTLMSL